MRKILSIGTLVIFLLLTFSVSVQTTGNTTNPHSLVDTVAPSLKGTSAKIQRNGKFLTMAIPSPPTNLVAHNPIQILSNAAFTTAPGVVSGSGSLSSPYIISGWNITNGVGGTFCIDIENTNKVVNIENNYLNDLNASDGFGIFLNNATNVRFFNNYVENTWTPISGNNFYNGIPQPGDLLDYNYFYNNTLKPVLIGMIINGLQSTSIFNNYIFMNNYDGINIDSSSSSEVYNNIILGANIGIYSLNNNPISITGNEIYNSTTGIYSINDWQADIKGNNVTLASGDGIYQNGDFFDTVSQNFINNTYFGLYVYKSYENNDSYNIIPYSVSDGIYSLSSNLNLYEINSISNSQIDGIYIQSSGGNIISGNMISNFGTNGIELYDVFNQTVIRNTISGTNTSLIGLLLTAGQFNKFYYNTIEGSNLWLELSQTFWNNVSYNTFQNTFTNGTLISNSFYNTIGYNSFADGSAFFSLIMSHGANNRVIGNKFNDSWYYDLILQGENNATVGRNAFLNPSHFDGSQALDSGVFNEFLYNYWDGWTAPDTNGDGLVDNPFPIDGPAHAFDFKPLVTVSETNLFPFATIPKSNTTVIVTVTVGSSTNSTTSTNKPSPGFTTVALISGLLVLTVAALLRRRKIKS